MIWAHAHLGGQITEHMILLMIFSTHAFSYHGRLWICSIFPHPARHQGRRSYSIPRRVRLYSTWSVATLVPLLRLNRSFMSETSKLLTPQYRILPSCTRS